MKITLFTSNQPRHLSLANKLASIADKVFCIQECNTLFPGKVSDFYEKSQVMQDYFHNVMRAERQLFGEVKFSKNNVKTLSMKSGDLNMVSQESLKEAMNSDIYIVFGASFIKGWLIDFLIDSSALNIHMGISPYYRGTACNFWALYDNRPDLVGSTIHNLSKGLDNGDILYHCLPNVLKKDDSFLFTMSSVLSAHESLIARISSREIFDMTPMKQDKKLEIRYSKNSEFNDDVAKDFLSRDANIKSFHPDRNLILPFQL